MSFINLKMKNIYQNLKKFLKRLQISTDEKGNVTWGAVNKEQVIEVITIEFIIDCLVEVPSEFSNF